MNQEIKPAVSVIVPIYNMEHLMRRCLDSILGQSFHDFECILVDDGSKDASGAICDEYTDRDIRFAVIHQQNGGLSAARNAGLDRAQGEYVVFIDPDDWIDPAGLDRMYYSAKRDNVDMLICDAWIDSDVKHVKVVQRPSAPQDHWQVMREMIVGPLQGWTWNKLIRRSVYEQRHIRYPQNIYACEDQYAMCEMLSAPISVSYLPEAFYHYMQYPGTLSRHYDQKTLDNDVKARDGMTALLRDTPNEQVVWRQKTKDMVVRAFQYGAEYYTSESFKNLFGKYVSLIEGGGLINRMVRWSCRGYYRPMAATFKLLLKVKHVYNKVVFSLSKNEL